MNTVELVMYVLGIITVALGIFALIVTSIMLVYLLKDQIAEHNEKRLNDRIKKIK